METIYALSTAQGKAGVAVVRLSGPDCWTIVSNLIDGKLPKPRFAGLRNILDRTGTLLDSGLVLIFEEGRSFTGEQSAELHLHGSVAVCSAVLRVIGSFDAARLAEPGEFTRRALLNDRLDLTEVSGLSDLLDAETEVQRQEAMRVYSGALSDLVTGWRNDLTRALALLEVTIDFADEEVPEDVIPEVRDLVSGVLSGIGSQLSGLTVAQELRRGFEVALVGAPNVGKSTLLNALSGREAALTSEIAGTTRDIVEVRMDLKGLPVTFIDTAGLRESQDEIERLGIARTWERAEAASLRIFLVEEDGDPVMEPKSGDLVYQTKADLTGVGISAKTGLGVDQVLNDVASTLAERTANMGLISREREQRALLIAKDRLRCGLEDLGNKPDEIVAAELYGVIKALESMIGNVGIEDILDEVFSSFCLGK